MKINAITPKPIIIENMRRAAVCMILQTSNNDDKLLMIQRAKYKNDPWSGHMAFPGGHVEQSDSSLYEAALRECREEIGVDLKQSAELVTQLSDSTAANKTRVTNLVVTPFVFQTTQSLDFSPNYEVADIVSIPLNFFADKNNRASFSREYEGTPYTFPCYNYQKYRIWGLSLRFIDELVASIE